MEQILNLTQHNATPDQISAGVVEPERKEELKALLTFENIPDEEEINSRAKQLMDVAELSGHTSVMIGGASYLMSALEVEAEKRDMVCMYAFSASQVKENDDGTRTTIFKHAGFVKPDVPHDLNFQKEYMDDFRQESLHKHEQRGNGVFNLTQHPASAEQLKDGVIEPTPEEKEKIQQLLRFNEKPEQSELFERACQLCAMVPKSCNKAMIGGAPFFIPELEEVLAIQGIEPVHAFSVRVSEEKMKEDGTVEKVTSFKHEGFVKNHHSFFEEEEQREGHGRK